MYLITLNMRLSVVHVSLFMYGTNILAYFYDGISVTAKPLVTFAD